jgi:electron transfer flavoprotein alpha subunit
VKTNIARSARLRDEGRRSAVVAEFDRVARMTPETAAAHIVAAVERGSPRVLLGPETYLIDWGKRLAPVLAQRVIAWLYFRLGPATR